MGLSWSSCDRGRILPIVGSGAYRVGCSDLMVKDGDGGDSGVFLRIFYPVDHKDDTVDIPESSHPLWLPRKEYLEGLAAYMKQSTRRLQIISDWVIGEKRSAPIWHDPLAGSDISSQLHSSSSLPNFKENSKTLTSSKSFSHSKVSFPVIVFSHGLVGCRHFYSTYCSSLASYGYVVAAIEHRDYSSCWTYKLLTDRLSGRIKERPITMKILESGDKEFKIRSQQLGKRVSECVKALHVLEELNLGTVETSKISEGSEFDWNQFKGRLNLARTAVIGHSFGGATAMAATAFSTDFQASVVLDGWMFPLDSDHYLRAAQPTLFLNAGRWQWKENINNMRRFSDEAERLLYTFRDAVHQSFSDFPFLAPSFIGKRMGFQGEVEPHLIMETTVDMSITFLRRVHEGEVAKECMTNLVQQRYSNLLIEGAVDKSEL